MAIDPDSLKAPFISAEACKQHAEEFSDDFWPSGDYPVDVLAIAEFGLRLEIRPVVGLKASCDVDALLSVDFTVLAVDQEQYMDARFQSRLRFSIAHEFGHYAMHRDLAGKLPRTPEGLREYYNAISDREYSFIEYQANQFAGALLVPRGELENRIRLFRQIRDQAPGNEEQERILMIHHLAGYFSVSTEVIENRLSSERL